MSHDRVYDRASGVNSSGGHVHMPKPEGVVKNSVVYINGTRMDECTEVAMSLGTHIDEDCNCHKDSNGTRKCPVHTRHPGKFVDDFRDACIRRAVGPVAADAIVENANMIATLTRCQEECTKLVQEKRNLERLLLREQEMHNKTVDRLEKKFDELEAARAELACVKTELASAKKGRDDDEKLFELRCDADIRAIKMWQAAHPNRKEVWPDHADMVVWLLEEKSKFEEAFDVACRTAVPILDELNALRKEYDDEVIFHGIEEKGMKAARDAAHSDVKNLKTAITILADIYVNHAELCRHNAGDLCDCNYHDMRRMWSTITGMDIRI